MPSPDGNGYIRGYLVRPFSADTRSATPAKLPGVVVIHENRGLNPHTMDVARRFALENFMAFAPDALTSVGGYPGDDFKGGQLFSQINAPKRVAGLRRCRPLAEGAAGLQRQDRLHRLLLRRRLYQPARGHASARTSQPARPSTARQTPPADVPKIKAAMLINHGALDTNLANAYPAQLAELKKNNIVHEGHLYPNSVHGFFNDATPERYNKATAAEAWTNTINWFNNTRAPRARDAPRRPAAPHLAARGCALFLDRRVDQLLQLRPDRIGARRHQLRHLDRDQVLDRIDPRRSRPCRPTRTCPPIPAASSPQHPSSPPSQGRSQSRPSAIPRTSCRPCPSASCCPAGGSSS